MSTQSLGRTVRTVKPIPQARNKFERAMWVFMRYSGLALTFLALSHFGFQHIVIGTHNITTEQTVQMWGESGKSISLNQLAWRTYYMAILGLAMLHGLNGVRQVAWDYIGNNKGLYTLFMGVVAVLSVVVTILGALALIFGATSMK
ncbi:MAG: hypothetical protein KIH69_023300 [Anaerolineae bacterium]|nr:hypothetical protein [Anaerolineae bacterium]